MGTTTKVLLIGGGAVGLYWLWQRGTFASLFAAPPTPASAIAAAYPAGQAPGVLPPAAFAPPWQTSNLAVKTNSDPNASGAPAPAAYTPPALWGGALVPGVFAGTGTAPSPLAQQISARKLTPQRLGGATIL